MLRTNLGSFESSVAVQPAQPPNPIEPLYSRLDANLAGFIFSATLEAIFQLEHLCYLTRILWRFKSSLHS